jgi:hypothetical protein
VLRITKTVLQRSWLAGLLMLVLTSPTFAAPVFDGLYILDGTGGLIAVDAAPTFATMGFDWGYDIARALALAGDENGVVTGYRILTGYGDVYSVGVPALTGGPTFTWDIARDIEPAPDWTSAVNGTSGYYLLDGFGGVFPVGDTSLPYFKLYQNDAGGYTYWGWDVAVDLEVSVIYDANGQILRTNGYYILDKYGAVHWCVEDVNGVPTIAPWTGNQPYFGWDIARAVGMTPTFKGYFLLDGYGGIHPVGDASLSFPAQGGAAIEQTATPYFGWDIARDIEVVNDETGFTVQGLVMLDGFGGLHEIGNVDVQAPPPLFTDQDSNLWDIAKDLELSPFFTFVTEAVVTGP